MTTSSVRIPHGTTGRVRLKTPAEYIVTSPIRPYLVLYRSKLCIKCEEGGRKFAECKKATNFALCADKHDAKDTVHHAGTIRCPIFKDEDTAAQPQSL
ncbi:hypothetical protein J6590_067429 [Homalodisca vitripennis]|nr:hypothetical protein J6590_067429 [Homalodisca vitripennis]